MSNTIDLIAELGIGEDAEPKTITLGDVELKLKTSFTGEEVLKFQTAYANTDEESPAYFKELLDILSADTKANTSKFMGALEKFYLPAVFALINNMAVHAGLIDPKNKGLVLGSARL